MVFVYLLFCWPSAWPLFAGIFCLCSSVDAWIWHEKNSGSVAGACTPTSRKLDRNRWEFVAKWAEITKRQVDITSEVVAEAVAHVFEMSTWNAGKFRCSVWIFVVASLITCWVEGNTSRFACVIALCIVFFSRIELQLICTSIRCIRLDGRTIAVARWTDFCGQRCSCS